MATAEEKLLVRWKARTDLIWLCNNILNFRDVTPKLSGTMVSRLFQFPKPVSLEEMKVHDQYDARTGKWIYRPLIVDESRLPGLLPDPNKMGGTRRTLSLDSRGFLKCLCGDQEVLVSDGRYIPVQDLLPGHKVLGIRDDFSLEWTDVIAKEQQPLAPCYKITLRSGRTVDCSYNHPFRLVTGWADAESLKAGDRIAVSGKVEPADAQESVPYAELLGWMLADGHFSRSSIAKKNPEHRQMIIAAAQRAGFDAKECFPDGQPAYLNVHNAAEFRYKRTAGHNVRDLWRDLGLMDSLAGDKFIPESIFRACQDDLRLFLRALFAGDGTCGRYGISYSSKSKRLIAQVQRLLLRFDIFSSSHKVPVNGEMYYQLSITSIPQVKRFFDSIGWIKAHRFNFNVKSNPNIHTVPKEWRSLYGKYFFPHGQKPDGFRKTSLTKYGGRKEILHAIGSAIGDQRLMNLGSDDLYWDYVAKVERIEDQATWAIETRNGTFAVSDVVTHNSSVVDVGHSVQWIINYPDITMLLFQGNLTLGQQFVGDVKNAFWQNLMMQEYFPELCCPMTEKKFGNLDEFTIPGRSAGYTREQPTMRARAIEQGGAGQHVEVIKYSDIVNEDNHESKEYCAKIADRFYNSQNTLIAKGKYWIDMDGTRYSTHDVYGEVIRREMERQSVTAWRCGKEIFFTKEGAAVYSKATKRPVHKVSKHYVPQPDKRLWSIYINCCYEVAHENPSFDYDDMLNSDIKFKIGEDGLPVSRWPERFPSTEFEEERETTPDLFACQKLNNPAGSAQDRKFPVIEGVYPSIIDRKTFNEEVRISHYEIAVDTAPTTSKRADYTSIVVAATDSNGRVFIVEMIHGKFHEEETADKILDAFRRYGPSRILMENDSGNRGIRVWLQRKALQQSLGYVPYVDVPRRMSKDGKQGRIAEYLRPWYMSGDLRIVVEEIEYSKGEKGQLIKSPMWSAAQYHFLEELRNINPGAKAKFHDDIADSIAMLFHDRKRLGRLADRPKPSEEYNKHILGKRAKLMEEARERAIFGESPLLPSRSMSTYHKVTGGL